MYLYNGIGMLRNPLDHEMMNIEYTLTMLTHRLTDFCVPRENENTRKSKTKKKKMLAFDAIVFFHDSKSLAELRFYIARRIETWQKSEIIDCLLPNCKNIIAVLIVEVWSAIR